MAKPPQTIYKILQLNLPSFFSKSPCFEYHIIRLKYSLFQPFRDFSVAPHHFPRDFIFWFTVTLSNTMLTIILGNFVIHVNDASNTMKFHFFDFLFPNVLIFHFISSSYSNGYTLGPVTTKELTTPLFQFQVSHSVYHIQYL